MKPSVTLLSSFGALLGLVQTVSGDAPLFPAPGEVWRYQLLGESSYLDDCPPCGRPSFLQPLRGSFLITPGASYPLFDQFELQDVQFNVGGEDENAIHLTGSGRLELGGEVALLHRITLRLTVQAPGRPDEVVHFTSELRLGTPAWPWISGELVEVDPSQFRVLHLTLDAMPIRDLWFSTRHGLTAGLPGPAPVLRSAADILSDQGRVTVSRESMIAGIQLAPESANLNADALDVGSGGVVQVSFDTDEQSELLDLVHHGDLVDLTGKRVKSQAEFSVAVGPMPGVPDLGLDAVQRLADGTYLFSIREKVFSETQGFEVGPGDLMSTTGVRVRSNRELLNAFQPLSPDRDYGLDAVFVWPSGEIWFSTEESVELEGFRGLSDGDLLSDRGRVVYGNLELLRRFGPLEDLANFGLDALTIVTDAVELVTPPKLTVRLDPNREEVVLDWTGTGRFFQVEQGASMSGIFAPEGPIGVETTRMLPAAAAASFFRVRQW